MNKPTRSEELKQKRRAARSAEGVVGQRLSVPKEKLDPNYEYRWINDRPGRIQTMTGDYGGWELVADDTIKPGGAEGTNPTVNVGSDEDGRAMRAYLARKPKEIYDIDQEIKAEALDEQMSAIRNGQQQHNPEAQALQGKSYTPSGTKIEEPRR